MRIFLNCKTNNKVVTTKMQTNDKQDQKIIVLTPAGDVAGFFLNPKVEMILPHYYKLSGTFYDHDGGMPHRIEFNPQVLPYEVDLPGNLNCQHVKLFSVYVQRSRQPVEMIGQCQSEVPVSN